MPSPSQAKPKAPSLSDCVPQVTLDEILPKTTIITGQTGSGKTTLAATLFGDLSGPLGGKLPEKPLTLQGSVWLAADEQAIVALQAKKILPQYVLDIRALLKQADGDVRQVLAWLNNLLQGAREVGAHTFVWDTASTLGDFLVGWYVHGEGCPESVKGDKNSRQGWGRVGEKYRQLYESASALGYRQIILAHPKQNAEEEEALDRKASAVDKAKATAHSVTGDNLIVPAFAGNMFRRFLNGACSLSCWLKAEDRNGKRVRKLMPFGGDGSQGKNRYEHILDREEPADLHQLDQKILDAVK